MPIRVAYDISVLGNYFYRHDSKSGIFRVVEELMYELAKIEEVQIILTGMCGDNLLYTSLGSLLYSEKQNISANYQFFNTLRSRLDLLSLYKKIFKVYCSQSFQDLPKLSHRSVVIRGILKALYLFQNTDCYQVFDSKKFDLFHSPYYRLPSSDLLGNTPKVLTIHDLIPVIEPQFVIPELTDAFRETLNSVNIRQDWIICVSEYTKQEFCIYTGMNPDRVFVVPWAAASYFHPIDQAKQLTAAYQKYGLPEGDYFLSIAALQPRKNLTHLIRCFFRLLAENPSLDVNLVLVGSKGWMYDEIFAAAKSSPEFHSRVIFTGYIPDEDLSTIYSGAKAFVYPSLYEGFGLPPLEAMQCGTPVITSNTTSLPEVVEDAGILIDPQDEAALCQAMLDILTDSTLCQELSRKGLEQAKKFSWAKCAADTVDVYKRAIGFY